MNGMNDDRSQSQIRLITIIGNKQLNLEPVT